MQLLEVSGAVRPIYGSLGIKRLKTTMLDRKEVSEKVQRFDALASAS